MEQHKEEIGTRQGLALYRIQTAKSDLKSARVSDEIKAILKKEQVGRLEIISGLFILRCFRESKE